MVLLVVDAQNGIVDERLYEFRKFVGNIKKLIGAAREQGIEVIYVQHDDGPGTGFSIGDDEFEVYSEFQPMPDEKRFIKSVCSAFKKESGLLEYLTAKEEKDVMNCGIMTIRSPTCTKYFLLKEKIIVTVATTIKSMRFRL